MNQKLLEALIFVVIAVAAIALVFPFLPGETPEPVAGNAPSPEAQQINEVEPPTELEPPTRPNQSPKPKRSERRLRTFDPPEVSAAAQKKWDTMSAGLVDADGKQVTLDLAKKPYVMLYFTAGWCPPCRAFTPNLVAFYEHYHRDNNFEIVVVSRDENASEMKYYLKSKRVSFPAIEHKFRDYAEKLVGQYEVEGIPCLVLLDHDWNIVSHSYVNGRYLGPGRVLNKLEKLLIDDGSRPEFAPSGR